MSADELVLHKDYEDYVELVGDFELSEDEIEYALSI